MVHRPKMAALNDFSLKNQSFSKHLSGVNYIPTNDDLYLLIISSISRISLKHHIAVKPTKISAITGRYVTRHLTINTCITQLSTLFNI